MERSSPSIAALAAALAKAQAQLVNPAEQSFISAQVKASNPILVQAEFVANPANLTSAVAQPVYQQIVSAATGTCRPDRLAT